jgi:hypothetical protein
MNILDRGAKHIEDAPAPIVPLCGQDRAGHPKDMVLLAQRACTRCDRFFLVTQLRDEAGPQFDDIEANGASVTACPGCGQALSLATVYDTEQYDRVSTQLVKRRSEVGEEDEQIDALVDLVGKVHSMAAWWNLYSWKEQQTQQRAP